MKVKINEISNCTKFFTREEINDDLVEQYSDLLNSGTELPPITVFEDPDTKKYSIMDGFHTYHAALKANVEYIEVLVTLKDTELDRFVEGVKKNSQHGYPLSAKDRRRNIEKILGFESSWDWSNQVIASIVGTSDRTVANVKTAMPSPKISGIAQIKCFRNGKPHTVRPNYTGAKAEKTSEPSGDTKSTDKSENNSTHNHMAPDDTNESEAKCISENQIHLVITSMKLLQQKYIGYTKMFNTINDGNEPIDLDFIEKLEALLKEMQLQIDEMINAVRGIEGRHES